MVDQPPTSATVIGPDDGDLLGPPHLAQDRFVLGRQHTGGALSVVEHRLAPRVLAGPVHIHSQEDEFSYVLEGTVGALLGEEELVAGPGTMIVKPRGQWHTFWNAGDTPARVLELITPSGVDDLFREMGAADDGLAPDGLAEMAARYGARIDMARTAPLVERLGLRF